MKKVIWGLSCAAAVFMTSTAQAGFVIEPDIDGLDDAVLVLSPNFGFSGDTTSVSSSIATTAAGLTGGDSVFGGNGSLFDTYTYRYKPGVDGDNNATNPVAGESLNQFGDLGSALAAGGSGLYNVYAIWPQTSSVSGGPTTYTLSDGVGDLFSVALDQNGIGGEWVFLASATLDAGTSYTLTQNSGAATFVSMRSAGVLFDAVPEPASLGLLGMGGLALISRKRR